MTVTLGSLAKELQDKGLLNVCTYTQPKYVPTLPIYGAACDNRVCEINNIFICKGTGFTIDYIIDAINRGAVAYVCELSMLKKLKTACPNTPYLVVNDIRLAMAVISGSAWGHPDKDLMLIGVTGSKGKTTTTAYIRAILNARHNKKPCGYISTHEIYDGVGTFENANTTPEPPDLMRHLAHARSAGLDAVVMEVSSQALKYNRVYGVHFKVACFLNINRDHISPIEHPTFEDYFESKLKIFNMCDIAVINASCNHSKEIEAAAKKSKAKLIKFSLDSIRANVFATDIKHTHPGETFTINTKKWKEKIELPMSGVHNIDNALAAVSCCLSLGISAPDIKSALKEIKVPGRMEIYTSKNKKLVGIVDYAHTHDSFTKLFTAVNEDYPNSYIISFFGVSGGKAFDRYKELPETASKYSDYIILTSDDPGPIDPNELVEEISANIIDTPFEKIPDREKACERAFELARTHLKKSPKQRVVVCALGKGAENTMRIGGKDIAYESDPEHVERLI